MLLVITKYVLLLFAIIPSALSRVIGGDRVVRVIGGDRVVPGDYPYFVQMALGCGGALVAPDVVLFAAHCGNHKNTQLIIGVYERGRLSGGAQERFCDIWIADPEYGNGHPINNDFALCKLNEPVILDDTVRLELNYEDSVPSGGQNLTIMGLGISNDGDIYLFPEFVRDTNVPYVCNEDCNKEISYNGEITDNMLCAGYPDEGGKDTCAGDSGGPIVKKAVLDDGSIIHTHVGVVSWGYGCAEVNYPGVYARTSKRSDWIRNTICNELESVAPFCENTTTDPIASPCVQDLTIRVTNLIDTRLIFKDTEEKKILTRKYFVTDYENEHKLCLESNKCYKWNIGGKLHEKGPYSISLNGEQIAYSDEYSSEVSKGVFCTGPGDGTEPPTVEFQCQDDKTFRFRNKKKKTCGKWVARGKPKNVKKKCQKWWKNRQVFDWCPETCGEKARLGRCEPSESPTEGPSGSFFPSVQPSDSPTLSLEPSESPTEGPSGSFFPSNVPSVGPTLSSEPSESPTEGPSGSLFPSVKPSDGPTLSLEPSESPTEGPSGSLFPSVKPSDGPTLSLEPSESPTEGPSGSFFPSAKPSDSPSWSSEPSASPSQNAILVCS